MIPSRERMAAGCELLGAGRHLVPIHNHGHADRLRTDVTGPPRQSPRQFALDREVPLPGLRVFQPGVRAGVEVRRSYVTQFPGRGQDVGQAEQRQPVRTEVIGDRADVGGVHARKCVGRGPQGSLGVLPDGSAQHGSAAGVRLPGKTESRVPVAIVDAKQRLRISRLRRGQDFRAAGGVGRRRTGVAPRQKTGRGQDGPIGKHHVAGEVVEIRDVARRLPHWRMDLPAQSELDRECAADAPMVLREDGGVCRRLVHVRAEDRIVGHRRQPQQKIGERVPAESIAEKIEPSEIVGTAAEMQRGPIADPAQVGAELESVAPAHPAQRIGDLEVPGLPYVLAAVPYPTEPGAVAEIEPWKTAAVAGIVQIQAPQA